MLQITINIIDYSNYITCTIVYNYDSLDMKLVLSFTNVERLFTTTNAQLLYLSPTTLYFVLKINFFYPEKIRSRTNITSKSLLAPCQASTRRPQLKSGDFLTEILYSASSPTVSCNNFLCLYFKITSQF